MKVTVEQLENKYKKADAQFQLVADRKREAYEFLVPNRAHVFKDPAAVGEKNKLNFDGYPAKCLSIFVNGLTSMLASPNITFLSLDVYRQNGKISTPERTWLRECENALRHYYGASQFYSQNGVVTRDAAVCGTGVLSQEMGTVDEPLVFSAKHPAMVRLVVDQYGLPTTLYRTFSLPAEEAIAYFAKEIKSGMKKKLEELGEKSVLCRHVVSKTEALNEFGKKASSFYYFPNYADEGIVREGAFTSFPYHVWMLDAAPNEPWGYGLGEQALGEVKSLNRIAESDMKITQLTAEPPMNIPKEQQGEEDFTPSGRNYYEDPERVVKPARVLGDPRFITDFHERRKRVVESWFYVDFFQMLTTIQRTMTAFEVSQRLNEKAGNIGPLVTSYTHPYLKSTIERSLEILIELKVVPPMPASLAGTELMVDFVSPLIKQQKGLYAEQDLQKLVELGTRIAQFDPQAPGRINWGEVMADQMKSYNLNPKYEISQKTLDEGAQQQQKLAEMQQMADVINKGGKGMAAMGMGNPLG